MQRFGRMNTPTPTPLTRWSIASSSNSEGGKMASNTPGTLPEPSSHSRASSLPRQTRGRRGTEQRLASRPPTVRSARTHSPICASFRRLPEFASSSASSISFRNQRDLSIEMGCIRPLPRLRLRVTLSRVRVPGLPMRRSGFVARVTGSLPKSAVYARANRCDRLMLAPMTCV